LADRKFRVVGAGAGVSGLFMAETLKRARIDFTVYEKAGEVGGTWRDNTFPGLFVDVLSRQYEFPLQPNYNWSRKYAPATEIWAYIKKVARDRGLTKFIRFNEAVVAARFTDGCWHIDTAKGNTDIADVFISASGAVGKDTVSRVWRKVKADWDAWNARSLAEEPIVRLILDGTAVRVRLDRQATPTVPLVGPR